MLIRSRYSALITGEAPPAFCLALFLFESRGASAARACRPPAPSAGLNPSSGLPKPDSLSSMLPGFRVRTGWPRPSAELLQQFLQPMLEPRQKRSERFERDDHAMRLAQILACVRRADVDRRDVEVEFGMDGEVDGAPSQGVCLEFRGPLANRVDSAGGCA